MPIKKENRRRYPLNWREIRAVILERAGGRCEGIADYPGCLAENGKPHPATGSIVVLTIAHLDQSPENSALENLKALCQRCHLTYDSAWRRRTRVG